MIAALLLPLLGLIIVFALLCVDNFKRRRPVDPQLETFVVPYPMLFSGLLTFGNCAGIPYLALRLWYALFDHPHRAEPLLLVSVMLTFLSRPAQAKLYTLVGGTWIGANIGVYSFVHLSPLCWSVLFTLPNPSPSTVLAALCAVVATFYAGVAIQCMRSTNMRLDYAKQFLGYCVAGQCLRSFVCYLDLDSYYGRLTKVVADVVPLSIAFFGGALATDTAVRRNVYTVLWPCFWIPTVLSSGGYIVTAFCGSARVSSASPLEMYVLSLANGGAGALGCFVYMDRSVRLPLGIPNSWESVKSYSEGDMLFGGLYTVLSVAGRVVQGFLSKFKPLRDFLEGVWEGVTA